MSEIERLPQRRLLAEQNTLEERSTAYGAISTQLGVLKNKLSALQAPGLFSGRTASVADETVATASASAGAVQGTYTFAFTQLASAAKIQGTTNAGSPLSTTSNVSGVAVSSAAFSTPITAGTFTVNGAQVTIATTDTLADVFGKISTATGGTVTATYLPASDKIRLAGSSTLTLGSATDTSNFLEVAKLNNAGTSTVTSATALGGVSVNKSIANANLATTPTFAGDNTGSFKVNGVTINYTAGDTIADVLARIGESEAGVTASYDAINDRFVLANKNTGDVGIAMQDVTGNFLAATRLSTGTLSRGNDLLYTINGGGQLRSRSNTITSASSGLNGLSVTALEEGGSTKVTVATDKTAIRNAITAFVDEYNKVQEKIAEETKLTADGKGGVTAGTLASETDAEAIASTLRKLAYGTVAGTSGGIGHLEALGYKTNSDDDTLELDDSALLDSALSDELDEVEKLWLDENDGLAKRLTDYLDTVIGDDGTLQAKTETLDKQSTGIDTQIEELERVVQANRERLMASFISMEQAQQNIKQQLEYLTQRFG
ncbi:MAG: flagellar filament capping protein FliD [Verrucomicrobiales bacterium]|nr:flagellar filament capping protein FliD [Verrucomicrobiales bacterium]